MMGSPWTNVRIQGEGQTQQSQHWLPATWIPSNEERVGGELDACHSWSGPTQHWPACRMIDSIDKQNASIISPVIHGRKTMERRSAAIKTGTHALGLYSWACIDHQRPVHAILAWALVEREYFTGGYTHRRAGQ